MFGDTKEKVTGVAVIAVILSGIMVAFLPVPFQMVIFDGDIRQPLTSKARESLMPLTELVTQNLFHRLLAHLVTEVEGFNINRSYFSWKTLLDALLYRRYF